MQLTSKGQVTIPKKFREKYGLHEGADIEFLEEKGGLKIVKNIRKKGPFDRVYGLLNKKLSTDKLIEKMRGR